MVLHVSISVSSRIRVMDSTTKCEEESLPKLPSGRCERPTKLSTGNQQNKSGEPRWNGGINEFLAYSTLSNNSRKVRLYDVYRLCLRIHDFTITINRDWVFYYLRRKLFPVLNDVSIVNHFLLNFWSSTSYRYISYISYSSLVDKFVQYDSK